MQLIIIKTHCEQISGELALNRKGMEELTWKHSYAKVYEISQMEGRVGRKRWVSKYQHDGVFMSFEHYRVEIRDRVKYISAKEGVCYESYSFVAQLMVIDKLLHLTF